MKDLKKFQLVTLFSAAMLLCCIFTGQAAALTDQQLTAIKTAVATCDTEKIEAVIKKAVEEAIVAGENPADAAEQAIAAVVSAAMVACNDVEAVEIAAEKGAAKGMTPEEPEAFEPTDAPSQPIPSSERNRNRVQHLLPSTPGIEPPPTQDEKTGSPT